MGNQPSTPKLSEAEQEGVLGLDVSVRAIAEKIKALEGREGVVVMAGAGISVSAGIPDFRTPGTGLYDNLKKYNLPTPTSIFDIRYFREKPRAFCTLAKEMYPGNFRPTPTHFFIKLLEQRGLLRRCFTQNIDTLERVAGISPGKLVEAHGSFGEAHCIDCEAAYSQAWVKEEIFAGRVPTCPACGGDQAPLTSALGGGSGNEEGLEKAPAENEARRGLVKPDIVFFGESLPRRFVEKRLQDLPEAEVLIIMGTSLQVTPFCELIHDAPPTCPRLLVNMELVGMRDVRERRNNGVGLLCGEADNYRDVALLGPCDDSVRLLAAYLGWGDALRALEEDWTATHPEAPPAPAEEDGESSAYGGLNEVGKVLVHNWRKEKAPLPPLRPLDGAARPLSSPSSSGGGGGLVACPKAMCTLLKPGAVGDLLGGRPAHFRVGLRDGPADAVEGPPRVGGDSPTVASSAAGSRDTSLDYLALYSAGAEDAAERTDRDFAFRDPSDSDEEPPSAESEEFQGADDLASVCAVAAANGGGGGMLPSPPPYVTTRPLRLRIPWVRRALPYDFEVWYVDGVRDEVLGRWGPLTLHANAPEDVREDKLPPGRPEGLPEMNEDEMSQLVALLSDKFKMPPEMVRAMVHQKMMEGDAGPTDEDEDEEAQMEVGGDAIFGRQASVAGSSYDLDDDVDVTGFDNGVPFTCQPCRIQPNSSGGGRGGGRGGALKSAFGALKNATGKSGSGGGGGGGGRGSGGALKSAFGALKSATNKGGAKVPSEGSGHDALRNAFGAFRSATGSNKGAAPDEEPEPVR
jgi:NAD-dependent deacetylase sirtuin 2